MSGDISTPVLGLVKPEVGASRSTWGTKWNTNADALDANASTLEGQIATLQAQVAQLQNDVANAALAGAPIGALFPWLMFTGVPYGYQQCVGQWLANAQAPALFAILGYRFGGDGATSFALPDLRGCVMSGYDGGTGRIGGLVAPDTPGAIGGAPYIGLTLAELAPHQHSGTTDTQGQHNHDYLVGGNIAASGPIQYGAEINLTQSGAWTGIEGNHAHNFWTDWQGSGAGHPNVQVTALCMWIIRAV